MCTEALFLIVCVYLICGGHDAAHGSAHVLPAMMMIVIIAGAQAHKAGNGDECDDEFLVHGVLLCLRYYKIATG